MSRKVEDLSPEMQPKARAWEEQMQKEEIDYLITCTRRTKEEQAALWAQGRTRPGPIVTWTMDSYHLTGDAFDFVIMLNGKPDWSVTRPDLWNRAIEIGEYLGMSQVIGKNGKVKELAHLQIRRSKP